MLKRAQSLGNTRDNVTTWHLKRTVIDTPLNGTLRGIPTSDCCPVHRSADDLDVSTYMSGPCSTSPPERSLNTFKPKTVFRDLFTPVMNNPPIQQVISPKHPVSVTRYSCPSTVQLGDEQSPYYFKLDPTTSSRLAPGAVGRSIADENHLNTLAECDGELKPDIVPGCVECLEQNRVPNTVV